MSIVEYWVLVRQPTHSLEPGGFYSATEQTDSSTPILHVTDRVAVQYYDIRQVPRNVIVD